MNIVRMKLIENRFQGLKLVEYAEKYRPIGKLCAHISRYIQRRGKISSSASFVVKDFALARKWEYGNMSHITRYELLWILCNIFFRFQEHSYIHSGKTDAYECQFCKKKFRFNSSISTHRMKFHPLEMAPVIERLQRKRNMEFKV